MISHKIFPALFSLVISTSLIPWAQGENDEISSWQTAMVSIAPPEAPAEIPLGTTVQPDEESVPNWVLAGSQVWLQNVTQPSITPYLAAGEDPKPTIILIPGGGFKFLSMSNEGWLLAEKFVNTGINVFVLKYRVDPTPADPKAFQQALISSLQASSITRDASLYEKDSVIRAREDAQLAIKYLRERGAQFNIDPNNLGVLGFSAGAITAMAVALDNDPDASADWVGAIYGSMIAVTAPASPPPLFVAMAADDPLFNHEGFGLIESWHSAGGSTELHWYARGGHGFGALDRGTTSDLWFEQFVAWLDMQ